MAQKADPDSRRFVKELAQMECVLVGAMTEEKAWLSRVDESALRWALSLARVSMVQMPKGEREGSADIGHATDIYRQRLYDLLTPFVSEGRVKNRDELVQRIPQIRKLVAGERQELIELYRNSITAAALDNAVRRRPLALALSGGGGTSYVFTGAFAELEEAGIKPSGLAGSSMGAVLGAYRALHSDFDLADFKRVMGSLSWDKVVQPFQQGSRFGVPSTFRLYLREVFGHEFERDGRFLRLCDLAIPLRVVVAGIPHIEGAPDTDLAPYAHLLDDIGLNPRELKKNEKGITRALLELATKPLRAIYLGQDELSREFDVLDAIGFSAAVPGVFHYDILRDDKRMVELVSELMRRHGVVRLIDGGFADNLPASEAKKAVAQCSGKGYDPFVVALDGFAPNLSHHWLFLPLMRMAAENSRRGREVADLTITYRHVLSPVNVVPSKADLAQAIANGRAETAPHIPFIRKMLGPIPDPPGVVSEMDGTASSVC